jgi:hypothetical protein
MFRAKLWFAALAMGLLAVGALAAKENVKKLSTYGYVGRQGGVSLVVDMDVARYRGGKQYIPLLIWLGSTENKTLHAERGSFTLVDPKGNSHPLATTEAVTQNYGPALVSNDYAYLRTMPDYARMIYLSCQPIRHVAFFPNPAGRPGVLYDHVELPNHTFFWTLLYFANPAGKDPGKYTFIYDDPGSKTHIEIPFTIPWSKN